MLSLDPSDGQVLTARPGRVAEPHSTPRSHLSPHLISSHDNPSGLRFHPSEGPGASPKTAQVVGGKGRVFCELHSAESKTNSISTRLVFPSPHGWWAEKGHSQLTCSLGPTHSRSGRKSWRDWLGEGTPAQEPRKRGHTTGRAGAELRLQIQPGPNSSSLCGQGAETRRHCPSSRATALSDSLPANPRAVFQPRPFFS